MLRAAGGSIDGEAIRGIGSRGSLADVADPMRAAKLVELGREAKGV